MSLRLSDAPAVIVLVCLFLLASCGGAATVASHGLIRAASPLSLSTTVTEAFPSRLAVDVGGVQDGGGTPIFVVFSAPAGGTTGTFAGGLSQAVVRVGSSGTAVAPPFTAGEHAGSYIVSAVLEGPSAEIDFDMTNRPDSAMAIEATGGGGQETTAGANFMEPVSCAVTDKFGNPVAGAKVEFSVAAASLPVVRFGVSGSATAMSDQNGVAISPELTAGTVPGSAILTAALDDSVARPVSFDLSVVAGPPKVLNIISGGTQTAEVLAAFAQPLSVQALDMYGNPVAGTGVTFSAPSFGATGEFGGAALATVQTDTRGIAVAPPLVAGAKAGTYAIAVTSGVAAAHGFQMTNTPGPLASLVPVSGDGQTSVVVATFPAPLVVRGEDAEGNQLAGVSVEFSLPSGGASADFGGAGHLADVTTGSDGSAVSPMLEANTVSGTFRVIASSSGASAAFGLTNEPGPLDQLEVISGSGQQATSGSQFPTPLRAKAVDAYGNGIGGLQVSFEVPAGAGMASFVGGASGAAAVTSDTGVATAPPVVAGGQVGSYLVEAKVSGKVGAATFALSSIASSATEISESDADRFLEQSGFGPTAAEVAHLQAVGMDKYLDEQFAEPAFQFPSVSTYDITPIQNAFFVDAVSGSDQLRARMLLALSGTFVVSPITSQPPPEAMTSFLGILEKDEFGNFLDLLRDVSLSPAMGDYLTIAGNTKADPASGVRPNENYGRELMQLFTIGLVRLRQDGSVMVDAHGAPIPTYSQADVEGNSAVLTGWIYSPDPQDLFKVLWSSPMAPDESAHDETPKAIVDGVVVPANGTAESDLDILLETLFNDPNTAPFICRQLIQALVESDPSPDYISRVASVFNDDGAGVRGDLRAVIRAILLDPEAREGGGTSGHLMSPALYLATLAHELGASTDGIALAAASKSMGEDPFQPPSVFGFYSPLYSVEVGSSQVLAPEFQVETFSTEVQRQNFVHELLNGQLAPGTTVDLSSFEAVAGQGSDDLLNELGRTFMGGSMPLAMKAAMTPIASIGVSASAMDVVRGAIEVLVTSPLFVVEH